MTSMPTADKNPAAADNHQLLSISERSDNMGKGNNAQKKETKKPPKDKAAKDKAKK